MSKLVHVLRRFGRDLIALVLWLYVFTKLFVFDFDVYLAHKYIPRLQWVLDFKFLFLFGFCAYGWLFAGTKRALLWLAFVVGYPFINLFWRLPQVVAKQKSWTLVIALLNGITSGIRSARQVLPMIATYLILLAHCLVAPGGPILAVSAVLLLLLMVYSFVRRLFVVFRAPHFYKFHVKAFTHLREKAPIIFLPQQPGLPLPGASQTGKATRKKPYRKGTEKWLGSLQSAVLFNRVALFWARRLRDYQKSGCVLLAHALLVLLIAFFSVFCFAAINYAVDKWDPSQFRHEGPFTLFSFVFYSMNNMVFNSDPDLTPARELAKILIMIQYVSDFAFVTVFVTMIVAHRGQRHTEELESAIGALESESKQMERLIRSNYNMTVEDAIAELQRLKASLVKLLLYLTTQVQ